MDVPPSFVPHVSESSISEAMYIAVLGAWLMSTVRDASSAASTLNSMLASLSTGVRARLRPIHHAKTREAVVSGAAKDVSPGRAK